MPSTDLARELEGAAPAPRHHHPSAPRYRRATSEITDGEAGSAEAPRDPVLCFQVGAHVPLGQVAATYGLSVPSEWREKAVSEVLAIGAGGEPSIGDLFMFGYVHLVVAGVDGGAVTGIVLEIHTA